LSYQMNNVIAYLKAKIYMQASQNKQVLRQMSKQVLDVIEKL